MLDLRRAREIIESPNTINVSYQGSPVWLENLNDSSNAAEITLLDRNERINVPLNQLVEK